MAAQDTTRGETEAETLEGAEALLRRWRERVLTGLISTSILALIPAWLIHAWQALQGVSGAEVGVSLVLMSIIGLGLLLVLRLHFMLRACLTLGLAASVTIATMLLEGFAPAQCLMVCIVTCLSALLFNARAAACMLATNVLCMGIAAYTFCHGAPAKGPYGHFDVTQPLNWMRVGLYTVFASATATAATSYLLNKLRRTLQAKTSLIERLNDEVRQRERALAELERTQAKLLQAQKLEAIGQLAAGIAHDFNNTLSVISLEAELLKRQHRSEGVARGADSLLGAAERGKQLTQQLLLFSRPKSLDRPTIDVAQTYGECADALRRLLPAEIHFEVELASPPLPVAIHPSELQQLVLNLGINARDAMPGGGSLRLSLMRRRLDSDDARPLALAPANYAVLCCTDNGCGMSEATLGRVFEPFFTTKGPGRGTGLGLTNVWNIADRAGGGVQIVSTPGRGTELSVYLPLSAAEGRLLDTLVPPPQRRPHETVLVVEDDIRIRALLVTTLTDAGYVVLDAPNVDQALAIERNHAGPIHVLCTDVVMPGRPARELIQELRARRPALAVVVSSGYSEDEQIVRGIRAGEFTQLDKPFTRSALLSAIRNALNPSDELAPPRAAARA